MGADSTDVFTFVLVVGVARPGLSASVPGSS